MILAGHGELECDGEVSTISIGDGLYIPCNQSHQFRNVGEKPLEFLCMVPVASDCGQIVPGS